MSVTYCTPYRTWQSAVAEEMLPVLVVDIQHILLTRHYASSTANPRMRHGTVSFSHITMFVLTRIYGRLWDGYWCRYSVNATREFPSQKAYTNCKFANSALANLGSFVVYTALLLACITVLSLMTFLHLCTGTISQLGAVVNRSQKCKAISSYTFNSETQAYQNKKLCILSTLINFFSNILKHSTRASEWAVFMD
jgi:hypothetical protein